MDKRDWYFNQRVLESQMDEVQDYAEAAIKASRVDLVELGIHAGGAVVQNAPPDLNVLVGASGVVTDQLGNRVAWAGQQLIDCSQDHLGNPTATAVNDRWLTIVAEYDQILSTPEVDGNGVTVYTRVLDSFNIYVLMGVEGVVPVRPTLPTDGIVLADIYLTFGQVQITTAPDIWINRRQDYLRETGTTLADFTHGDPNAAIAALYAIADGLAIASGIGFTPAGTWHDATAITTVNVEDAINEIVADLAEDNVGAAGEWGSDKIGSDVAASAHGNMNLARGSVWDQLLEIQLAVDDHIDGSALNHLAADIAFAPYSWIAAVTVQAAVQEIVDDLALNTVAGPHGAVRIGYESPWGANTTVAVALNARPEKDEDERIDGEWLFQGEHLMAKTLRGGTMPPGFYSNLDLPSKRWWRDSWANPLSSRNLVNLALNDHLVDIGVIWSSVDAITGAGSDITQPFVVVLESVNPNIIIIDPRDMSVVDTQQLDGWAAHTLANYDATAMCMYGTMIYVCFDDAVGVDFIGQWDFTGGGSAGWKFDFPGGGLFGGYPLDRICIANNSIDIVAIMGAVVQGGAGVAQCLNSSGVSQWRADGDAPATAIPAGGLASDGTNVYFTCRVNAGAPFDYQMCSATIAAGGDPGIALPATCSTTDGAGLEGQCHDLAFDGHMVWFVTGLTYVGAAATNANIGWYDTTTDAFLADAWTLDDSTTERQSFACCIDGLNLWLHDYVETAGSDPAYFSRLKSVPLGDFRSIPTTRGEPSGHAQWLKTAGIGIETKIHAGRMAFDGDSIFCIIDDGTWKDILVRVPRAGSRN